MFNFGVWKRKICNGYCDEGGKTIDGGNRRLAELSGKNDKEVLVYFTVSNIYCTSSLEDLSQLLENESLLQSILLLSCK